MGCRSADAGSVALGAEAVVADVLAHLHEQIHVVSKTALVEVKDAVRKDAADSVCAVVAKAPKTLPAGVMEMGRIPGLVGEALLFGAPAQFFSHVAARSGAATGLFQPRPGRSGNGQKGWSRKHVNALVDVVGGLGQAEKAVVLGSPLQRFHHGCSGEGHAVVVDEQHNISLGLLQHCVHPAAVVQLAVVLGQRELKMLEDAFLFVRQTGIGSWPVEGMDLRVQGSGLVDAPCSPIVRDRSPSGDAC